MGLWVEQEDVLPGRTIILSGRTCGRCLKFIDGFRQLLSLCNKVGNEKAIQSGFKKIDSNLV